MKNLLLFIVVAALTGCMSFSDRSMRPVKDSISQQLPEIILEKEFAVSIGGGIFNFLDIITLNEADLSDMDRVQVAVYKIHSDGEKVDFDSLNFEQTLLAKDDSLHWDTIVRVREKEEQVWILAGMDLEKNSLQAVAVFVLERDELVLINIDGDMDELLEYALQPARGHRGVYKS